MFAVALSAPGMSMAAAHSGGLVSTGCLVGDERTIDGVVTSGWAASSRTSATTTATTDNCVSENAPGVVMNRDF